ncbi:MAG TPA: hypothetical protein VK489_00095 [Ferruginibacter sp.]|nr:hypothetical protein [Ferruginibacter sp.]
MQQNNTNQGLSQSEIYDLYAPAVYGKILGIVHKGPIADKILEKVFIDAFKNKTAHNNHLKTPLMSMLNQAREKSYKTIRALSIFTECCAGCSVCIKGKK